MKKIVGFLLFLSLIVSSCAGTKYKNAQKSYPDKTATAKNNTTKTTKNKPVKKQTETTVEIEIENSSNDNTHELTEDIVTTATDNIGTRYRYGGIDKSGFDCSGLVYTSFKKFDIALPRSSYQMADFGQKLNDSEIRRGDLVFFITNGGKRINHVGIVTDVSSDGIEFVHSSTKRGVIISSTKEPYYQKNYVKAVRVLN